MTTEKEHIFALKQGQKTAEYDDAFVYFHEKYMPKVKQAAKICMIKHGHSFVEPDNSTRADKQKRAKKQDLEPEESTIFGAEDALTHDIHDQMAFDGFLEFIRLVKESSTLSAPQLLYRATKEKQEKWYKDAKRAVSPSAEVSLNDMIENEDNFTKARDYNVMSAEDGNPVSAYDNDARASGVNDIVNGLQPSRIMVIYLKYMMDQTRAEIAKGFGLTQSQIRKVELLGLKQLRQSKKMKALRD